SDLRRENGIACEALESKTIANPWTWDFFWVLDIFDHAFTRAEGTPGQGTGRLDTVPPDDLLDNALAIGSPHVDAEREMCAGYCHRFCPLSCRWQRFRW